MADSGLKIKAWCLMVHHALIVMCGLSLSGLLAEIAFQQASEALSVASLVASHLMNGVVDGVEVLLLSELGDAELVLAGTSLGSGTFLKVGLSVPNYLSEELGKLSSVLSLLKGVALESLSDLRVSLTVGLT